MGLRHILLRVCIRIGYRFLCGQKSGSSAFVVGGLSKESVRLLLPGALLRAA
jgi:hypothetical protein